MSSFNLKITSFAIAPLRISNCSLKKKKYILTYDNYGMNNANNASFLIKINDGQC